MLVFKVIKILQCILKSNMKQHQTKQVLCSDKVKSYLESLHRRFAIVTIDKAAKKYVLICKGFTSIFFLMKLEYYVIPTPKIA